MDKCREEFESYMLQSGYTEDVLSKSNHYDCYHDITIDAMYSAWKSSRESMKAIKLPDQADYFSSEYDNYGNDILGFDIDSYSSDVVDAITSAGYKVEE